MFDLYTYIPGKFLRKKMDLKPKKVSPVPKDREARNSSRSLEYSLATWP